MARPPRFLTVLFGSLGDTLMALALFDDALRKEPGASLTILTRKNAEAMRELAREYPSVAVAEIPRGIRAPLFFARILGRPGWTFLTLGLASAPYSFSLRLFLRALEHIPGNRTIGFWDRHLDTMVRYDPSRLIIENFRRLLFPALPRWRDEDMRAPVSLALTKKRPRGFAPAPGAYLVAHLLGVSIPHALPPRRWRHILREVATAQGLPVVLTGVASQRNNLEEIARGLPGAHIETALTLPELAWVIDNAALYVGIDTGVTHIAALLGKPSVVVRHCSDLSWAPIYNPNARVLFNPEHCNPDDPTRCRTIKEDGRAYRRCAYEVSDDIIITTIGEALRSMSRTT